MKLGVVLAALAGLAGTAYLIFVVGFEAVWQAVTSIGWGGYALLWLFGMVNFALLGTAWVLLAPPYSRARTLTFWWARAVRDSAGDVLPFSQLGGMVIGARAAILRGAPLALAFGTMVVDVTVEMVSQICFVIVGAGLLVLTVPMQGRDTQVLEAVVIGIVLAILGAGGFVVAQRRGFSVLEHLAARFLPKAAGHAGAINEVVNGIHRHRGAMLAAFAVHLCGWIAAAFGTWLALQLIGKPLAFADCIAIESILAALRSATVFVPGAIGVQEAGYALMLPLFGLPPEIGVAVSLLKRAREIGIGAPILVSWQLAEGGHAARGARARVEIETGAEP